MTNDDALAAIRERSGTLSPVWHEAAKVQKVEVLQMNVRQLVDMLEEKQSDIRTLLALLTERDRELAAARERLTTAEGARRELRKQLMETRDALTPFARSAEFIGQFAGSEFERQITSMTAVLPYDWKRAQEILAHEVADIEHAARQPDGGEREA